MYFLVMSQHTIHCDMKINELRQCCFDSGASLTGFVLQPVSLISMASVVQMVIQYSGCHINVNSLGPKLIYYAGFRV